jgi:putative flippase GtrA
MNLKTIFLHSTNNTFLQFFRYLFVGGFAFLVDFALLWILTDYAHLHYLWSATLSFLAGLLVNYFLSKAWVFNNSTVQNKGLEFLIFALIGVIGLGFNNLFLWVFTDVCSIYYLVSKIITTGIVYFWNFFARKYVLFNVKSRE